MAKQANAAQKRMYGDFAREFDFCWCCGWALGNYPRDWSLSELHIAHIVGGPGRSHDRRNIWRACEGCHAISHGARRFLCGEIGLPITLENVLWMKSICDPAYFDLDYIRSRRIKRCEELNLKPVAEEYQSRFLRQQLRTHEQFSPG